MKNFWIIVVSLLLGWESVYWFAGATVPPTSKPIWNATYADILKRDLLMTYDKFLRPTEHFNKTTVRLALEILHVDVDEAESVLHVHCWLRMVWNDSKLKWNISDYANLKTLHLAMHEVWQPDIMLYNSATANNIDYYGNTHLLVENNGTVSWVPPTHFRSFCSLDLRYWPYDTHTCKLILGSWVMDGRQIDLELFPHSVGMDDLLITNNEWLITNVSAERHVKTYTCCDEPYVDVTFTLMLERNSPMYRTVITVPAIVVIFMTLATFWLPAHHGEKILLNGINAVVVVMFLIYFAQKLNVMAYHTPLIVTFYSNTLYMICFSTLISVVVINFTRSKHNLAVPWLIKKQLDGPLEKYLFLAHVSSAQVERQSRAEELRNPPFDESNTSDDLHMIQQSRGDRNALQNEWIKLAVAIDRITFVVYVVIFFFSALIYSI